MLYGKTHVVNILLLQNSNVISLQVCERVKSKTVAVFAQQSYHYVQINIIHRILWLKHQNYGCTTTVRQNWKQDSYERISLYWNFTLFFLFQRIFAQKYSSLAVFSLLPFPFVHTTRYLPYSYRSFQFRLG